MKPKFKFLIGIAVLGLAMVAAPIAQAQSTNNVGTFFVSAEQYFTAFNTNYTFEGVTFEASTGYKQQIGVNAASYMTMQYDIGRVNLGTSFLFSGVGSAVNEVEAQIGYAIVQHYDLEVDVNFLGGYSAWSSSGVIEPEIDLKKKLTPNTFAEIGMSMPQFLNQKEFNSSPTFKFGAGFTF
jgi:hypothetical protein